MVAGDFNGVAWLRQSGSDSRPNSIIEEASPTRVYLSRVAPHLCGYQEACQVNGRMDVCGFLKPVGSETIRFGMLGLNKQIKVAVTKFGCTSSTLMVGWLIVYHETRNLADQG